MKSEVVLSVPIDPVDGVYWYCTHQWRKLSQQRKHAIIGRMNMSIQMQKDLKEMRSHMLW